MKHLWRFLNESNIPQAAVGYLIAERVDSKVRSIGLKTKEDVYGKIGETSLKVRSYFKSNVETETPNVNLSTPSVKEPTLVEYNIEEHTTPKTNSAKAHWAKLSMEERIKYQKRPDLLKKKDPGYHSHWDIRIENPNKKGQFISFVTKKCAFPQVGDRHMWVQSTSGHGYHKANDPICVEGYGAGVTRTVYQGHALVWSGRDGTLHVYFDCNPRPFVLVPAFGKGWDEVLVFQKPDKLVFWEDRVFDMEDLSSNEEKFASLMSDNNYVAMRKYDGAHFTIRITKNHAGQGCIVEIISRKPAIRNGKMVQHGTHWQGIDRSDQLLHIKHAPIPEKYWRDGDTVLSCEVYAKGTGYGNWDHPLNYSTSVLNSHPVKAYILQQKYGLLRVKMLDVQMVNGQKVGHLSFKEKIRIMEEIHKDIPVFRVPKMAHTTSGKYSLLNQEEEYEYGEGVILRDKTGRDPKVYKFKFKQTWDLKIVGIIPVEPTSENSKFVEDGEVIAAGCFILENGQQVKITTDEMKYDAHHRPNEYIGSYAEVQGMSMGTNTGKIRAPVLVRVRDDK